MRREDLTAEQRQVVASREPTLLVFGGAGTGKTTTALWAARDELERPETPVYKRVLFLTFSRTAVAQIRSRAHGVLTGIGDRVEVLTFHGLAYRMVRDFGRFAGRGVGAPVVRGETAVKLLQRAPGDIEYDEFVPLALELLSGSAIGDLLADRWSLVVCDEFQDTDDAQWALLEFLGRTARLLLLADPNQMIYTFRADEGVGPARLVLATARPGARTFTLPSASLRDPSQVLPSAAEAVRQRRFGAPVLADAVRAGRLLVYHEVDQDRLAEVVTEHITALGEQGCATVGVYAQRNTATAELSAGLTALGVEHAPVGFPEAYGEALSAMAAMLAFAAGAGEWDEVMLRFATFLTASDRGKSPPILAYAFADQQGLPGPVAARVDELRLGLSECDDVLGDGVILAARAWTHLLMTGGHRHWWRAAATFGAVVARAHGLGDVEMTVARVDEEVIALRSASLVDLDAGDDAPVQVMNFTQTKGREADASVLVFRSDDWFGTAGEPFEEASRLLYVAMTRARQKVVVLLPPWPHDLVAPFLAFAQRTASVWDATP